ncbi:MAG TPA: phage integrase SAM-like domain-containing protein [Phycisphaerae bacterium]|nr:phage integrase SAM-like domain-containing protein [Phycisphaerae bacterium]
MASLQKLSGDLWRVQVCIDGERQSVRLGKFAGKEAELRAGRICKIIEELAHAKDTGDALPLEVRQAVDRLSPRLLKRFAKAGLVDDVGRGAVTLGAFVNGYILERGDVKPSTREIYEIVRENIVAFLGADKALDRVTEGDAEDFRRWLSVERGLSVNTTRRRCAVVKQFFAYAVKKRLIQSNPFGVLRKLAVHENRERFFFIDRETITKVLDKIVDPEWRLLVALSRYGGLRCPSEHLSLRWDDILWAESTMIVRQPKLEHCEGHETRRVPIFPELMPFLLAAFNDDRADREWVIGRYRSTRANLRTQFTRYIRRAGLQPWPRLWHALRAGRQTELCQSFPVKAVCEWLGNSALVASRHYLMTTPADWERAISTPTEVVQKVAQQDSAGSVTEQPAEPSTPVCDPVQASAMTCDLELLRTTGPLGLEPRTF